MAKTYAKTVTVPEFDEKAAYDQDRPISSLIRTQLLHLTTAENLTLPPELRTGININTLHTERDAGEYIQRVTALLHKHGKAEARKAASRDKEKTRKNSLKKDRRTGLKANTRSKKRRAAAAKPKSRQVPR